MRSSRIASQPHKRSFKEAPSSDKDYYSPSPKRRAKADGKRLSERDETAFDDAPNVAEVSSQQVLQAFQRSRAHRKDDFLSKLQNRRTSQRTEIDALVAEAERQRLEEDAEFKEAFDKQIKLALKLPTSAKGSNSNNQLPHQHPLRQVTSSFLELSNGLIDKYAKASKTVQDAKPQKALGENWGPKREKLVKLLQTGRRVTERQINSIISSDRNGQHGKDPSTQEQRENCDAAAYFGIKTDSRSGPLALSKVLSRAEKGMRKVVTALPAE